MSILVEWDGDMRVIGKTEEGATVSMEPGRAYGGSGRNPTPMELVAIALGGCTCMDVVSILKKMRCDLTKLVIEVKVKRREQEPRYYESIHLTFIVSGKNITEEQVRRAVDLSNQKYCSVGIMLGEKAEITYDVRLE